MKSPTPTKELLKIKVLSLFDGISVAQQALKELGYDVEYYASEIDKYAIQITQKNHPNTIQWGSVTTIDGTYFTKDGGGEIDLLIGGSPCQDLSIAKKNRQGLDGARSGLFWEYVRILKEVKPKYFVLENVNSMPKEAKAIITEALGVEPIMINASLVSAQNRKRLFWTNIPNVNLPEDRGILLKDILEKDTDTDRLKSYCIDASYYKGANWRQYKEKGRRQLFIGTQRIGELNSGGQGDRIYSPEGKSVGLSALGGGRGAKTGLYAVAQRGRNIVDGKRKDILGAKTEQRIEVGSSEKMHTLTSVFKDSMVMANSIIRKLTPIECERLQSLHEIEQLCIIRICLDNQKNSVNVEVLNPKSQSVVGNVEKEDSKETAKSVAKNFNTKNPQENKPVQVDVSINCSESSIDVYSQNRHLANVCGVELNEAYHPLKHTEDFVRLLVGLNTIVEKTTPFGEAVLPQRSNLLVVKESGNNVVNIYGKGITQLAEDVKKDSITLNKLLKSTISDPSIQGSNEQTIQTLFSYVVLAILRYIPEEILEKNTLIFQINTKVGYTYSISNSQRYKCLGNAFNKDVVKHILSFIK